MSFLISGSDFKPFQRVLVSGREGEKSKTRMESYLVSKLVKKRPPLDRRRFSPVFPLPELQQTATAKDKSCTYISNENHRWSLFSRWISPAAISNNKPFRSLHCSLKCQLFLNDNIVRLRNGFESLFTVPSVIMVRGRPRDCSGDFPPAFSLKTKRRGGEWRRKMEASV